MVQSVRLAFLFLFVGLAVATPSAAMSVLPKGIAISEQPVQPVQPAPATPSVEDYEQLLAELVVVEKSKRRLHLVRRGKPVRSYPISLGFAPEGHKQQEGDGRTPEGTYRLDWRRPSSRFYKAIHIDYPNETDRMRAVQLGVRPGGLIMIHGQPRPNSHADLQEVVRNEDWTKGCIAVSNLAIEEIWEATRDGTPIEIRP